MKNLAMVITTMFLLASFSAKAQIDLKENQQQKEEAFSQIMEDEQLLNEFMNRMMNETESMNWMMENQQFMNHMFMDENLDYIMNHNDGMDQHMMQNMGNVINRDPSMRKQWDHMMEEDMMDEDEHMHQ